MNYRHVYMLIVEHAKSEMKLGLRPKSKSEKRQKKWKNYYFEFHHILPRSLYPNWEFRSSNLVCLTAREHFFCHQLLTKVFPTPEMYFALSKFMSNSSGGRILTSYQYEQCRKATSVGNSMWSSQHKEETLRIIKKVNEARLKKFEELRKSGEYESYKKARAIKANATRKQNFNNMTEEEKRLYKERASKSHSVAAKNSASKRLETMKGMWDEINKKIALTKSKWSDEEKQLLKEKCSNASRSYWGSISKEDYEKFCKNKSEQAKVRNKGRCWWTNGIDNKFCKEQPDKDYYKGMTRKVK